MALLHALETELNLHYSTWRMTDLTLIGGGLEFRVYRANSATLGQVAIRVPLQRRFENANDSGLDARTLLAQEAAIARHLSSFGLPVPAIHGLYLGERMEFLVSEYIPHDGTPVDPSEMGRLFAALHRCPPPDLVPVAQSLPTLEETLAERLHRRTGVVAQLTGEAFPCPPVPELQSMLQWPGAERRLLHMDFRPANLLTRQGQIEGLMDWSNALVGDPVLDLARTAEFCHLDAPLCAGYGAENPLERAPRTVELLYRLDTATMLALVFLSEAPDPDQARRQVERMRHLYRLLP